MSFGARLIRRGALPFPSITVSKVSRNSSAPVDRTRTGARGLLEEFDSWPPSPPPSRNITFALFHWGAALSSAWYVRLLCEVSRTVWIFSIWAVWLLAKSQIRILVIYQRNHILELTYSQTRH
jgi:hypothetical protein